MIDPFAVWLMIGDTSCGCNLRPISMFIMIEELRPELDNSYYSLFQRN